VPVTEITPQQPSYFGLKVLALGTQFLYTTKRPDEKDRRKEFDFNDLKLPCWRFSARGQAKPKPQITEFA